MESSQEPVIEPVPSSVPEEITKAYECLATEKSKLEKELEPLLEEAETKRREASEFGDKAVALEQRIEKLTTLQQSMEQA